MRKNLIYTISGGLRIVCHHPFLVGVLGFLYYLYRSTPFVFSLLVYASPVLLCTAILLGTLLSFGELNLPEVEVEEQKTHHAVSLKIGAPSESYLVEGYAKNRGNVVQKSIEEASTSAGEISLDDQTTLVEESLPENELESKITEGENGELGVLRDEEKSEMLGEDDGYLEMDDAKSTDSFDSKRVYVDPVDSPPRSSWKGMDEEEEEEEEEEKGEPTEGGEATDSGSNGDESSSPDASMTDIIPMLDELHPLLDEDTPQQVHSSHDGSHDGSTSESECSLSDEEMDTPPDLEVEDDDNDNQEVEDDDNEEEKQEQSNPVIMWTEEDQKNLMDLGSSEIERNQQLEKLLARRGARKHTSMVLEKDLIDFDSSDLSLNIAPISTRQNPFDIPSDSYTMPGSAPSILLPRRNPFDIPYPAEDKPNLRVDGFQEQFMTSQSTVPPPFFQRVGTFNVGPSFFAANGHERQDMNIRPYFITEQAEPSGYSQFQGHSNEVTNSKASSVVEMESINSVEDLEDRKEPEPMSKTAQVSEDVGRGSQLSGEEGPSEFGEIKKRYVEVQLGDDKVHDEGSISQVAEVVEQRHSQDSSSSSSSEVSQRTGGVAEEPGISTPPSESTDLSDVPHKNPVEPVYDSSPPEIRRNLSSTSMDTDVMDMDFLPVLIKQTVPLSRRESEDLDQEVDDDNDEEDDTSNTIEMPTESSSSHPVNEDDSRLKSDTGIREHDIVNSNTLEVVQRSNSKGALMEGSSNHQNENYQHKESKASEDQNLDQLDNYIQSMVSDANLEEVSRENETSIADYPDGKTLSYSGNELASSNESGNEPPIDHHSELQGGSNTRVESKEEVRSMNNMNIPEVPEFDHEISSYNSPSTPEFISIPCNDSSATAPPGLLFSEECTRGEATSSHLDVQTIIEDADGIKEIDEGVLSEVESDFNGSSLNWSKKQVDCGQESLSSVHETGNVNRREVDSTEVKATEHAMALERRREEFDTHEDAKENAIGRTDLSEREFSGSDVKQSLSQMASKDKLHAKEKESMHELHEHEIMHADPTVDQKLNLEEGNMEKQVDTKSEDKPAEDGANEAGSSKVVQDMKTVPVENLDHQVEMSEGSSSTTPDKGKTRSSHKSSSSSSSSSSDSGSD